MDGSTESKEPLLEKEPTGPVVSTSNNGLFEHSKRNQFFLVLLFFTSCFVFLFILESRLEAERQEIAFDYKEYYLRPFHYKLDPFSYVELKNGVPITEPEPPNPYYALSFEELLVNRFVDYLFWTRGPTDEADVTVAPDRIHLTIEAFGGHLRNRIYYRLERDELHVNPILLKDFRIPAKIENEEDALEPNKLIWTTIPYCTDPLLEEALHELGNIHGFLFVRGNHKNYRFLDKTDTEYSTEYLASIPMKTAYLYDHNFLNFTRYGYKKPVHISMVCEPIDRKIRHFYTERHNYKNWAEDFPIASTKWWKQSLEECMNETVINNRECRYENVTDIKRRSVLDIGRTWLPRRVEWTIPQFCDYDRCMDLGKPADLEYVKDVVRKDYTVVGTLEQLDATLDLLEAKVPQFFKGIKKLYKAKVEEAAGSSTANEAYGDPEIPPVSDAIKAEMAKRYAPEIEFYKFVSKRLEEQTEDF